MEPLFLLSLAVTAFTFYHVGQFLTLRKIAQDADRMLEQMQRDTERWSKRQKAAAEQALADKATGNPIGQALAREMGVEL